MWSKNKAKPTKDESGHIEDVKALPCSVCDTSGPSEAHEPIQGEWWISIALCPDCHRGAENGLHGRKTMWRVMKMDEWTALAVTIRRLRTGR